MSAEKGTGKPGKKAAAGIAEDTGKKKTSAGRSKKTSSAPPKKQQKQKTQGGSIAKKQSPSSTEAGKTGQKQTDTDNRPTHIVGIGSSAGGLEALEKFFTQMPDDTGMAFVLVPHLDPTAKSIMHELLQKYTDMVVTQVEENTEVLANHIYVIPPDRIMDIDGGTLHLQEPPDEKARRHPIDYFFRSLAKDQDGSCIGIILSGTGSEGGYSGSRPSRARAA